MEQLRLKSWDDLHKLWYVLLKEKLMLNSEKLRFKSFGEELPAKERCRAVRKSMAKIKFVLTERANKIEDRVEREELIKRINAV